MRKFKIDFQGVEVIIPEGNVKREPLTHHKLGLTYTATGYGRKIPTEWKLYYQGFWRRVYAVCISNVTTLYILVHGEKVIVNER